MEIELRRKMDSESSILPLINVVFLLLIFFMIAGSLAVTEPFKVAELKSKSDGKQPQDVVKVLMGTAGKLALNSEVVSQPELLTQLQTQLAENPDMRIQLKADSTLAGNEVILMLEALREIGVEKLHLLAVSDPL